PVLAQCAPDPDYTNTKSPNPEVDASYELAIKLAKEVDADVVAITDPDGDRLGVVELIDVEVGGKKIIRKKEIGEIKISKVEDENFSICDVKTGGTDIFSKFNAKAKLLITTKQ
ncbi:MAG: hypothetical protein KA796_10265, partial [Chryseobacterium sp.]|nr:hypothetical protein [Chryseobacterium sp.]